MGGTNSVPVAGSLKDPSSANALATLQNSIAKLTKKVNTVIEKTDTDTNELLQKRKRLRNQTPLKKTKKMTKTMKQ